MSVQDAIIDPFTFGGTGVALAPPTPLSITAYVSDFSIISAMSSYAPCKRVSTSNEVTHKDAFSKMMKMAAALHMVTATHGPYKSR